MKTVLNKCPLCGGRIAYTRYHQYSRDYLVKLNGTLSEKPSKKYADMDMDSGFLHCTSSSCDWVTNCDLEVDNPRFNPRIRAMVISQNADGRFLVE